MSLRVRGVAVWLAGALLAVWPVVGAPAERPFEEAARTLTAMANGERDAAALRRLLADLEKRDAAQQRQFAAAAGKRLPPAATERMQAARAAYAAGQGRLLAIVTGLVRDLDAKKDASDPALLSEAQELVRRLEAASRRAPISAGELKVKAPALVAPALATGAPAPAALFQEETAIGPVPLVLKQAAATLAGPVDVYEWVRNTIRPELYHGVMKGAERTYAEGSGNDADTAALLIQMLRAKGIPARFVRGTVEMPGAVLQAMVGTASVEQAVRVLERAGIPHETVMGASGIATVKLERVWAEAYVPYANYRGAVIDQHGKAWIPLDAGFKRLRAPQVGDPQRDLGLDAQALVDEYLAPGELATPRENVRARVTQRLAETGPALSYDEFLNHRDVLAENLGLLPSTLPYRPTGPPEVGYELPDVLRHTIHFKAEAGDRMLLEATLPVADLLGRRLTLSYVPFAPEDEDVARQFGGLLKTPPYLVQVKPVLKSGGVDLVGGTGAVGLGVKVTFTLEFHTPGGTQTVTNDVVAGNLTAIGLGGRGVARQEELGGKGAQILSALAQAYLESWDKSDEELAAIFKVVPVRPTVSACFVLSEIDVDYAGGDPLYPVRYDFKGIAIDADLRASAPVGIVDRAAEKAFTIVSALEGSVLEHRVFEDTLGISAVSTAKALGLAAAAGITVHDLTEANVESVLPGLPLAQSVKAEVRDATGRGFRARVPAAPVSYLAWTGVGYVLIDEETGEAAYQLQGGHSGGVTAPSVIELPEDVVDPLLTGDEDPEPAPEDAAVAHVQKFISVDFQEGTVDRALTKPLKVLVTDADGFPVRNAFVTFTVIGGGGRLTDPALGGFGESEVVVRSDDRGEAVASLVLGTKTDLIPRYIDLGGEFKEQVGLNLVAVRSGLATLPEPFIAIAYPDYRERPDGRILLDLQWKGQEDSCFACGWPNLRVAALMALDLTDQHGNPISNAVVRFVYRPDPVPNDPPTGWVRMRPGTTTPGRVLKVSDYLSCLATTANPIWGECAGEAAAQTVRSSPSGVYAYAALGDSPLSYYYFDIKNDRDENLTFVAYPTNGLACRATDPSACGGDVPTNPIVSMGQRGRVTNRLGNAVEAYAPESTANFDLWVDQLSEDVEAYLDSEGNYTVRGTNQWRRERLLDSVFTMQPTTPGTGTTAGAAHIGNGTYRAAMTMAPDAQLNTVRYQGTHVPWWLPYIRPRIVDPAAVYTDGGGVLRVNRIKDPQRATTSTDQFSLWGVKPEITRLEPAPVLLDASGAVTRASSVEYAVAPADYRKLLAPTDILFQIRQADGTSILAANGQNRDATFDVPRGLGLPAGEHTAHLDVVGVQASGGNVQSPAFPLPTCQLLDLKTPIVVMSYTRDPLNGVTCGREEELLFVLCRDARVTLTVADQVVTGAIDNGIVPVAVSDVLLAAGAHKILLPPGLFSATSEDSKPFALRAVDVLDPTLDVTAPGTLEVSVRNRSVLPVGHTFVKGVDLLDGHLVRQGTDLKVAGRHLGLEMARTYSSAGSGRKGVMGAGWVWNWETSLAPSRECGLVTVTTPDGSSQTFRTTDGGITFKAQKGYHTRLVKLGDGSFDFTDKAGTRYHFQAPLDPTKPDGDRRLEYVEEPHLDRLVPTYDTSNRVTRVAEVHPEAGEVRALEISYEKAGGFDRVARAAIPALGLEATYTYDTFGNLVSATRKGTNLGAGPAASDRVESFEYSATEVRDRHQMRAAVDPNGNRTEYEYYKKTDTFPGERRLAIDQKEEFVRRVREFALAPTFLVPLTEFQYDYTEALSRRFQTTVKDARLNETLYVMNGNGSPLEIREPLGRTTRMEWATDDIFKTRETDPLLRVTTYGYDLRGNLTSERIATPDLGVVETRYEYDTRFNKLTLKTDAEGRATRYDIDPDRGDLVRLTDAVGNKTEYRYDTRGRLTEVIDPRGHSTPHSDHDSFGNARQIEDPLGNRTEREYDLRGRLVGQTDTFGREMTTTFDGLDQPVEVTRVAGGDSDDEVTRNDYYGGGQLRSTTNAGGATTSYTLDGLNRVIQAQTTRATATCSSPPRATTRTATRSTRPIGAAFGA